MTNYAQNVNNNFTFTVGNPGTATLSIYAGTVNNIVIHDFKGIPSSEILAESCFTNHPQGSFSYLAINVSTWDETAFRSSSEYVSYLYVIHDDQPNPCGTLSPFFTNVAAAITTSRGFGGHNHVDKKEL